MARLTFTPEGDPERDHLAYASPGLLEFLAINRKMSNVGPEAIRSLVAAADSAAVAVADMQKAGVGILAGCDAMIGGFCLHDELMLMVKGGMSPAAALQTAGGAVLQITEVGRYSYLVTARAEASGLTSPHTA